MAASPRVTVSPAHHGAFQKPATNPLDIQTAKLIRWQHMRSGFYSEGHLGGTQSGWQIQNHYAGEGGMERTARK